MNNILKINKVAVLGAGVMGAQIAALFVNFGIKTVLFDLPAKEFDFHIKPGNYSNINALVNSSIESLASLHPCPIAVPGMEQSIEAANYETDLHKLKSCDFILEVISDVFEWKVDLYKKIVPYVNANAILATNTAGLSIAQLASALPIEIQERFFGVHFFNPPRYMKLVELISSPRANKDLTDNLEAFIVSRLEKCVIRAKDTPNFIVNRIGVFGLIAAMHYAEKYNLSPDLVDALIGTLIGRSKSAIYRTMDLIGLDTFSYAVATEERFLQNDPWHKYFKVPAWILALIDKRMLGRKTDAGIYKKINDDIYVLDKERRDYRQYSTKIPHIVREILKIKEPLERIKRLKNSNLIEAQFLWDCFRELFHYCAYHLKDIAYSMQDIDLAATLGYGWSQGPFELWQSASWYELLKLINEDIQANKGMSNVPLPDWVNEVDIACHASEDYMIM